MPSNLKKLIKNSLEKSKKEGKLQSAIRKSLENLAENKINVEDMIVGGLAKSFAKLPDHVEKIIESYAGKVPESGKWTSEGIIAGFNMLSIRIREKVIKKIAEDEDAMAREWAMYMFIKNFDNFSEKSHEEILIKFSGDEDVNVKGGVLLVIVTKFSELPKNVRKLLEKFASDKNPETRILTAHAAAWKFKEIHPFGKVLDKLAQDRCESVRKAVACAIIQNFRDMDENAQEILIELSKDTSTYVRKGIANALIAKKGLSVYREIFDNLGKDEKMKNYIEELTCAYHS